MTVTAKGTKYVFFLLKMKYGNSCVVADLFLAVDVWFAI